jgi:prepilin peptidase CpaA
MSLELIKTIPLVPLLLVLGAGCVAAFTDVRSFKIPNYITFPLLLAGIAFHAFLPTGQGVSYALLGMLAGFTSLILFYVLGGVGAGDVKLMAAIGTWIGPVPVTALFLVAAILMGLYAAGLALWQGRLWKDCIKATLILQQGMAIVKHLGPEERVEEVVKGDARRKHLVPFAVMVLGGIAVLIVIRFAVR